MSLLAELRREGADVSDIDGLGLELERTRLGWELERRSVKGLGPKRSEALVDRFQTLWGLRQASVDDVAALPTISRSLAEKVVKAIH